MNFGLVVLGAALVGFLGYLIATSRGRSSPSAPALPGADGSGESPLPGHLTFLYTMVRECDGFYDSATRPEDLLEFGPFVQVVEILADERFTARDLFDFVFGSRSPLTCAALVALGQRCDPPVPHLRERLLERINDAHAWYRFFALRALAAEEDRRWETDPDCGESGEFSLLHDLFREMDESWLAVPTARVLETFLEDRLGGSHRERVEGEIVKALPFASPTMQAMILAQVLRLATPDLKKRLPPRIKDSVSVEPLPGADGRGSHRPSSGGDDILAEIGRFVKVPDPPDWEEHESLERVVGSLTELILDSKPPSMLLVGEPGVGRSTVVRALASRLQARNWRIFEANAASVVAGQVYVGELEQRIRQLMSQLGRRQRIVWHIPNFHEMIWAGRGSEVPRSILNLVLPYVERGELVILGETNPSGHERLLQHNPQLRFLLHTIRMAPLGESESRALGEAWGERNRIDPATSLFATVSLAEIQNLSRQYLSAKASPGNLIGLLEKSREQAAKRGGTSLTREDVLDTLAEQTGLPRTILDEREELNVKEVREFFDARLMGQPDAVDCLVERLSMIKAGLTDPTRPLGVFLFAGPTGTGKTEMGKVLAKYLFSSPERMIRLDMSELQSLEDLGRIIGDGAPGTESVSLIQRIRSQPFSVILLDEFEKAHRRVWDLFLQMFDDGRLTDRMGNTADFRNSVVIMTSNAGFENVNASIGFSGGGPTSGANRRRDRELDRRLRQTFRPELLNRMDRVVTFRPLDRPTMRSLIRKELNDALQRRGLRTRSWAVEWDSSAVDFLLEQGFTSDLGARPLKRAIERHLLAPLAQTIVNRETPGGDQFLFVRSDGARITVTFVDPDAPEEPADPRPPREDMSVESIVLDPVGLPAETEFLRDLYEEMRLRVTGHEWVERKEAAFARMAEAGFWELPERFVTLGEAEYMDRIESGFETAGSLLNRLCGGGTPDRRQIPKTLVQGLAQQLLLLNVACRDLETGAPRDAFLRVTCETGAEHGRVLGTMYRSWANKRRMRSEELEESSPGNGYRLTLSVSGFGAHSLLAHESGLHVFEIPGADGRDIERYRVRVTVVPQPETPAPTADLRELAARELENRNPAATVVRVYRFGTAPLVRDRLKHWRTGRVERVLDGDFDLLAEHS